MTTKLKNIVSKAAENKDENDTEDEAEDDSTNEVHYMSEKEHEKSVNITPPLEYAEERVDLRNLKCNKCKERFINKQFLESHTRSKHVQHMDNNLPLATEDEAQDRDDSTNEVMI